MRRIFLLFFIYLVLSFFLFLTPSLAIIANQLKSIGLADRARQKVDKYHEKQKDQIDQILSNVPNFPSVQIPSKGEAQQMEANVPPPAQAFSDSSSQASSEVAAEGEKADEEENSSLRSVDYTVPTQVFYKRDCPPEEKDCVRGAVLTNIKSVIFDYSKTRGSFME